MFQFYEEHFDYIKETLDYVKANKMELFMIMKTTRGCHISVYIVNGVEAQARRL